MIEAAPSAAAGAIGALEAGDAGLDASAEVAQLAVDPGVLGHVGDRQAAFFMEGDIADAARLGGIEIVAAGIAAVGGHLAGRRAAAGDVAVEHRQEALGIGRVAGFDDEIEDQATLASDQIELVTVLHVASAPRLREGKLLTMMSACGSNRLTTSQVSGRIALMVRCSTTFSATTPAAGGQTRGRMLQIFEVKGQFLVTELALLLQDRTAQDRFRRQPASPGLAQPLAPQVTRHQARQDALPISTSEIAFSSQPIWCPAKTWNTFAWTVRS